MDFLFYVIKHHLQLSRPVNKHLDYLLTTSSLWSTLSFWGSIAPNNYITHGNTMADAILRQSTTKKKVEKSYLEKSDTLRNRYVFLSY